MIRRPPRSTRTDTLFPYTTLFRSTPPRTACRRCSVPRHWDSGAARVRPGQRARSVPAVHHLRDRLVRRQPRRARLSAQHQGDGYTLSIGHFNSHVISSITRSEEHTSELQSLMRISYAVFCLNKKNTTKVHHTPTHHTNPNSTPLIN